MYQFIFIYYLLCLNVSFVPIYQSSAFNSIIEKYYVLVYAHKFSPNLHVFSYCSEK